MDHYWSMSEPLLVCKRSSTSHYHGPVLVGCVTSTGCIDPPSELRLIALISLRLPAQKKGGPTHIVGRPARGMSKNECVLFLRQRELKDRVNPRSSRVRALVATTLEEEEVQAVMPFFLRGL